MLPPKKAPSRRKPPPSWIASIKSSQKVREVEGKAKAIGLKHGFRSGLEGKTALDIEAHGHPVRYEVFKIPYRIPATPHSYLADFILRNGIIIETKGRFLPQDRAKHLLIKDQYPELDVRFVFSRSSAPIAKGSKTTLADWCERYGFRYADKVIPETWYHEDGPEIPPETIIKAEPTAWIKRGYQLPEKVKR